MTQEAHHEHSHVDPAEAALSPTELLNTRMNRMNLGLSQLQELNMNALTALQRDCVFCLQVIAAVQRYLPANVLGDAMEAVSVPAYGQHARAMKPTFEKAGDEGVSGLPPIRHDEPAAPLSPLAAATRTAQDAINTLGEQVRRAQQAEHTPAAPNVRQQPRSLTPQTGPNRPTRENPTAGVQAGLTGAPNNAPQAADFLGHFIGTGSVFSKFFSPEVLQGGKGFVTPGYGGFHQYKEDVAQVSPRALHDHEWASGFYRDSQTRLQQFFMSNAKIQVLVTNLPNMNVTVTVSLAPFTDRVDVRQLTVQQMQLVYGMVHAAFIAGERIEGNTAV